MAEHKAVNFAVVGSSPTLGATKLMYDELDGHTMSIMPSTNHLSPGDHVEEEHDLSNEEFILRKIPEAYYIHNNMSDGRSGHKFVLKPEHGTVILFGTRRTAEMWNVDMRTVEPRGDVEFKTKCSKCGSGIEIRCYRARYCMGGTTTGLCKKVWAWK